MTEKKTLGQIAYEATKADPFVGDMVPDWEVAGVGRQKMWQAAAQAVKAAVLEEATQELIDMYDGMLRRAGDASPEDVLSWNDAIDYCMPKLISRIRSLKSEKQ